MTRQATMVKLNQAIAEFKDWHQPWRFTEAVLSNQKISDAERDLFKKALEEACHEKYWVYPSAGATLEDCARNVEASLQNIFSSLSEAATASIAKAASYQWK